MYFYPLNIVNRTIFSNMKITHNTSLLDYNTFGLEVSANHFVEYDSAEDLQMILRMELIKTNKILHIGSGSNLLFLNDFEGVIIHSNMHNINILEEDEKNVLIEVGSGVVWDDLVEYAVKNGWAGIENLSLIPGETGAAAVQNIGAYGSEVQEVIHEVKTVEIDTTQIRVFSNDECKYGYRDSVFKNELKNQYIITSVIIRLDKYPLFNLNYQQLEQAVLQMGEINLINIRKTVIAIREAKLPDPKKIGNAGSFFMNPIISSSCFYSLQKKHPQIPHYHVSENEEKVPAGWLIEQCGWKGKKVGNTGVHDKQALVLVNRGGATGNEIKQLALDIQQSVKETFGIELKPEVNYI